MLNKFDECLSLTPEYIHVENDASYFVKREGEILSIFFEWSNGELDWKHNFMFPAKPYRDMKNRWFCHRGFLKVWKSIEPYIVKDLLDPTVKYIHIGGYSHGAAIAQLCHEYVKFNRPDVSVCGVGFGAPRVFWGFARKAVKKRFEGFTVVRNRHDIVTYLPPIFFGFRHICKITKISKKTEKRVGPFMDHTPNEYIKALEDAKE